MWLLCLKNKKIQKRHFSVCMKENDGKPCKHLNNLVVYFGAGIKTNHYRCKFKTKEQREIEKRMKGKGGSLEP